MDKNISADAQKIAQLGGPTKVARMLGFSPERGTQRVQNWMTRGIPVRIKYEHPHLFDDRLEDQAAA